MYEFGYKFSFLVMCTVYMSLPVLVVVKKNRHVIVFTVYIKINMNLEFLFPNHTE